jgi:hypothetical protein
LDFHFTEFYELRLQRVLGSSGAEVLRSSSRRM